MKSILLGLTLLLSSTAIAAEKNITQDCRIEFKPVGIYYFTCPPGSVTDGVDSFLTGSNFPQVRVRCKEIKLVCAPTQEAKDI